MPVNHDILQDAPSPTEHNKILFSAFCFMLLLSLLLMGAISGFFYAYSCSVMRGFNAIAPEHAIIAMQGVNATIRNMFFAPAFFGPPLAAFVTALLAWKLNQGRSGIFVLLAGAVYFFGAFVPTFSINVPMNEALAPLSVPSTPEAALKLWTDYSVKWAWWNDLRMGFSALALLLTGAALFFARAK